MAERTRMEKTVLVIEDSPTQALHLRVLLENEGIQVVVAEDGCAGLEKACELIPDLVLLDLQMPGMNGLQVCQELKARTGTSDIPVVLFTAHDEQETVVLGLQLGAVDFIPKDVFADIVLLETLRQMGLIGEA